MSENVHSASVAFGLSRSNTSSLSASAYLSVGVACLCVGAGLVVRALNALITSELADTAVTLVSGTGFMAGGLMAFASYVIRDDSRG